jgi:hypothetical protein
MSNFAVPAGTPENFIGGDLLSKHFLVGPQSTETDIPAWAVTTEQQNNKAVEINNFIESLPVPRVKFPTSVDQRRCHGAI